MIKQSNSKNRKWYFWVGIVSAFAIGILLLIICLNNLSSAKKITICTQMDYHGDIGPCIKYEEVEIVVNPENESECPVNTEPVYSVVGGFVGLEFVGCAKSQ